MIVVIHGGRKDLADLRCHRQLLDELTAKTLLRGLALFDLAAWKLPQPGELFTGGATRNQQSSVLDDYRGRYLSHAVLLAQPLGYPGIKGGAALSVKYDLPTWHVAALRWFEMNAGRDFAQRPFDVGLPVKVTSLQKGIWKPAGTEYALSVVQTHKGIYEDQDPIFDDEGVWTYFYHQQGKTPEDLRDPSRHFANVGLMRCERDGIPVGVIIPATEGRGYQVLGLAFVEKSHTPGYFKLVGPVSVGALAAPSVTGAEETALVSAALVGLPLDEFDPAAVRDDRLKVIAQVHRRQGGPRFRRALLRAYGGRCAMTEYDAEPALEAAHIIPYRGPQTNHPANGLLLRADMHDLFDLGLVAVETATMRLRLADELAGTKYEQYDGKRLLLPDNDVIRPSVEALDMHRAQSAVA